MKTKLIRFLKLFAVLAVAFILGYLVFLWHYAT